MEAIGHAVQQYFKFYFPEAFEPGRIGTLCLKNRLIKAPTVTGFATRDGCVNHVEPEKV
jgi:2,4-dienoyl-CoA reductase-like NADH-dependent reductase (Old Yellow Enzyme family)